MHPVIGILAAGASRRMRGRDKLLEDVAGEPLLARQVRIAAATKHPVLVALRRPAAELPDLPAVAVSVPDAEEGMAASLRALVSALPPNADMLVILLADLPEIETADVAAVIAAARETTDHIVRGATPDGRPGHPVAFPRRCFAQLAALQGDSGARELLRADPHVRLVRLADDRALVDLDTPEAWAAWRRGRGLQ